MAAPAETFFGGAVKVIDGVNDSTTTVTDPNAVQPGFSGKEIISAGTVARCQVFLASPPLTCRVAHL
jgi:hypothetical protein